MVWEQSQNAVKNVGSPAVLEYHGVHFLAWQDWLTVRLQGGKCGVKWVLNQIFEGQFNTLDEWFNTVYNRSSVI